MGTIRLHVNGETGGAFRNGVIVRIYKNPRPWAPYPVCKGNSNRGDRAHGITASTTAGTAHWHQSRDRCCIQHARKGVSTRIQHGGIGNRGGLFQLDCQTYVTVIDGVRGREDAVPAGRASYRPTEAP